MATCPVTVFDHLDEEWDRLLSSGQLDAALRRWRAEEEQLSQFTTVLQLTGLLADRCADPERQSDVLLALLRQAPDDRLAARLLLQRLLPPLKAIAGWSQPMPHADWVAQIVSAAFEVIVTYPVERRPGRVAANIVWDVRKRMYAALAEHRRWEAELSGDQPDEYAPAEDHAAGVEAGELLRWAAHRSSLPRDTARLIVLTRAVGFPLEEVAARAGVPSSRLRQRRWRSEQRLREVLASAS